MNARIDEAAVAAGRAPEAVRRLYNISGSFGTDGGFLRGRPTQWAAQLAELTLEQGMATYILGTDDPDDVRRFGEEVAPAVRDLVAGERERRSAAPSVEERHPDAVPSPVTPASAPASAPAFVAASRPVVTPTPDDGTRLTGILPWDEASRPTYPRRTDPSEQAAYGPAQLAAPQHLVDVHDHLRAELTQVRDVVDQVVR